MTALRAVFWDVDGTLADTEMEGHRPAFNQAFRDLGLPFHWNKELYSELLSIAGRHSSRSRSMRRIRGSASQNTS
jgi:beta-phosphoglucomutase-like phosphatase (HAD superfamily)